MRSGHFDRFCYHGPWRHSRPLVWSHSWLLRIPYAGHAHCRLARPNTKIPYWGAKTGTETLWLTPPEEFSWKSDTFFMLLTLYSPWVECFISKNCEFDYLILCFGGAHFFEMLIVWSGNFPENPCHIFSERDRSVRSDFQLTSDITKF